MKLGTRKQPLAMTLGATLFALGTNITASAATFHPHPLLPVSQYTTTLNVSGDSADIYFPIRSDSATSQFPIALMLQGAFVDKADYANYASQVASYGFVVVVPNRLRTTLNPAGEEATGLIAEQQQVHEVLSDMMAENAKINSPLKGLVDTQSLGLLGHSLGALVAISATQEEFCLPAICTAGYVKPPELKASITYAGAFGDPQTQTFFPIQNGDTPIGLIAGSLDGVGSPSNTQQTYNQVQNPPKVFIQVEGANHYSITNADNLEREPNRPTLEQAVATETIARWSGLFLRAYLLNDRDALEYVYQTGDVLDRNVSTISQKQPIPEPSAGLTLLAVGVIGLGLRGNRSQN
ncbi:chlorophyllase [Geitlerinema splendidum]|nr:chlorophyllase [Geitlerinema splendidum]